MTRVIDANRLSDLLSSTPNDVLLQTAVYNDNNGNLYRFINNLEDVIIGTDTYKALPFNITFPQESYNNYTNKASLTFDNISQDLTTYLRQNARGARIDIGIVAKDSANNYTFID